MARGADSVCTHGAQSPSTVPLLVSLLLSQPTAQTPTSFSWSPYRDPWMPRCTAPSSPSSAPSVGAPPNPDLCLLSPLGSPCSAGLQFSLPGGSFDQDNHGRTRQVPPSGVTDLHCLMSTPDYSCLTNVAQCYASLIWGGGKSSTSHSAIAGSRRPPGVLEISSFLPSSARAGCGCWQPGTLPEPRNDTSQQLLAGSTAPSPVVPLRPITSLGYSSAEEVSCRGRRRD